MNIRKWQDKFSIDCDLHYPSESTQKSYKSVVSIFLFDFNHEVEPKAIATDDIKKWILTAETSNTRRSRLCAVKAFYRLTVGMPKKVGKIPYHKKEKKLPIVLSQGEVQRMFDVCENLKHRTILAVLYATGLRISELINLKIEHVDRERNVIHVIAGKGKKDRQVTLAPVLLKVIDQYLEAYSPKEYLLNGQFDIQYSRSSIRNIVKALAIKAGIEKRVWVHLMRHNCFTHMLENGVDLNMIQRMAGHTSIKSTNIYAHVSHNIIANLKSPLSNINFAA